LFGEGKREEQVLVPTRCNYSQPNTPNNLLSVAIVWGVIKLRVGQQAEKLAGVVGAD
jgi:hypothetical protein